MSYDHQKGRFILVTADHCTGSHQLHNFKSITHAKCIEICQSMPPTEEHKTRMILKTSFFDEDGK